MGALGRGVVCQSDVLSPLYEPVEVVGIDGHLVVDGGQPVELPYGVGDERRVVDTLGHVAFVAGEKQNVVEVKVASLKHSHNLYTLGWLAMERDACRADNLAQQTFECL